MSSKITRQQAIQDLINSDKYFLSPAEIAPILGMNPESIRLAARQRPDLLKFEFIVTGSRTRIPRIPFLQYIGINIDNIAAAEKANSEKSNTDMTPPPVGSLSNEELLYLITQQLDQLKKEINQRLDNIEKQSEDLNKVLQSARNFINTLSSFHADN